MRATAVRDHVRQNLVAYLALFVALGGTSYAAAKLPRGSVGPQQLRANAVTSAKVRDGSLLKGDFRAGELPGPVTGPQGPAGPAGLAGPQGPAGPVLGIAQDVTSSALTPEVVNSQSAPITIARRSRLLVFARGSYTINCTSGAARFGLVTRPEGGAVVAVAGSAIAPTAEGVAERFSTFGISEPLDPGAYRIAIAGECVGAANPTQSSSDVALGAVAVDP